MNIPEIVGWVVIWSIIAVLLIVVGIIILAFLEGVFRSIYKFFKWIPLLRFAHMYDESEKQPQILNLIPLSKWYALCIVRVVQKEKDEERD